MESDNAVETRDGAASSVSSDWDEVEERPEICEPAALMTSTKISSSGESEEEEFLPWLRADIKTSSSLKDDLSSSSEEDKSGPVTGRGDGQSRAEPIERGGEEKDLSNSVKEDQKKPETGGGSTSAGVSLAEAESALEDDFG